MHDLDDLFSNAKAGALQPSDALMQRVLADADREQPQAQTVARSTASSAGFWAGLAGLFGGGGVLAGIGSAAVAGVFLGFVQPTSITSLADAWATNSTALELMPGIDALLTEE